MKVYTDGFSLVCPATIPLRGLLEHVRTKYGGRAIPWNELDRQIHLHRFANTSTWVGLVLTTRDHKKFCEIYRATGEIQVRGATPGTNLADFNCFAVDDARGVGMYQRYHTALSTKSFLGLMLSLFSDHRADLREAHEKDCIDNGMMGKGAAKREARDKYGRDQKLKAFVTLRPENFEEAVRELTRVQYVEMIETSVREQGPFLGLSRDANRKWKRFSYSAEVGVARIARALRNFLTGSQDRVEDVAVRGVDGEGDQITLHWAKGNRDVFDRQAFDDVADSLNRIRSDQFYRAGQFNRLREQLRQHPLWNEDV